MYLRRIFLPTLDLFEVPLVSLKHALQSLEIATTEGCHILSPLGVQFTSSICRAASSDQAP